MLIERLQVRGLLSFGPKGVDLELEPLNVLVGANASGKSNLIATLELLKATASDPGAYLDETGGHREWLWKGQTSHPGEPNWKPSISATVRLPDGNGTLQHGLSAIAYNNGWSFEAFTGPAHIAGARRCPNSDEQRRIHQQLADIRLYRNWTIGAGAPTRRGEDTGLAGDVLTEDADNLATVVAGFSDSRREQLTEYLNRFDDRAIGISTPETDGKISLVVEEREGGAMPASALSDGTLRYLSLFTILLDPNPPPLIAIEEPERGLHPDLMMEIAKLMWAASERTQLIVTTHSQVMVDEMTEHPSSVVAFDHYDGETHCRRVDPDIMSKWQDAHSLGDVWASGGIRGNRW